MEFKSEQNYLLLSPRKIRPVADVVRKMSVKKVLDVLPFIKKNSSLFLLKVFKSAVSSASEKGVDINNLKIKEIVINEGPRLKRGMPVSRGRWHPIKKRMSHIRVVLQTKKSETFNSETKQNEKEVKEVKEVKDKNQTVKKENNKKDVKNKISRKEKKS